MHKVVQACMKMECVLKNVLKAKCLTSKTCILNEHPKNKRTKRHVISSAVDVGHLYLVMRFIRVTGWARAVTVFYTTRYIPRWQQIYFLHTAERHFHKIMFQHMTQPSWRSKLGFLFNTLAKIVMDTQSPFSFVLGTCVLVIKKN